jgi:hypothetical protein
MIYHRMSNEYRCALLRLDTLVKRPVTCIMFIFDILGGIMNSPNLLSALELNTPRYRTRFLGISFHRTNYEVHEPMSAANKKYVWYLNN